MLIQWCGVYSNQWIIKDSGICPALRCDCSAIKDVRANCFCKPLLHTQIHTPRHTWARALSNKINKINDRADGHCHSFCWINDLGRTVTPVFLLMDHFLYRFSAFSEKMKKVYRLEVLIFCKMHDWIPFFLALRSSVRRIQMPFEGLRFVKTLVKFRIIYATDPLHFDHFLYRFSAFSEKWRKFID